MSAITDLKYATYVKYIFEVLRGQTGFSGSGSGFWFLVFISGT
jgi:hypothetical protein